MRQPVTFCVAQTSNSCATPLVSLRSRRNLFGGNDGTRVWNRNLEDEQIMKTKYLV